jgi:ATPase components of ABC transporters with duplicated ATPase domains
MTLLLNCDSLSKAYGSKQLFSGVSLGIFRGDRIGLVGPNGAGKSTLLKIVAGIDKADDGIVSCKKSLRVGYVPQSSEYPEISVHDVVLSGIDKTHPLSTYEAETQVTILLSKLGFKDPEQNANTLSGGWKKRLDIAKQLINEPDILLLDEPTNHLDLEGIVWLESFLKTKL